MTNNKAREVNNPIIKQLLDETTAEELTKIDTEMTNNKQQTTVEWFIEELEEKGKAYEENQVVRTINICIDVSDYMALKIQAKEMERQQIINAFWNGDNTDCTSEQNIEEFAEQYYEQTYGGGEQ
jgi:hypothetical protein